MCSLGVLVVFLGIYILPSFGAYVSFNSSTFNLKLNGSSQTLASLSPKSNPSFDFSPFDVLGNRSQNGNYHLGDVTLRYRQTGQTAWTNVDTAQKRAPVSSHTVSGDVFSVSNLAPTISGTLPFSISLSQASFTLALPLSSSPTALPGVSALPPQPLILWLEHSTS